MTAIEQHTRLQWVEIARLLAILSVIMQHVPCAAFPPNQWVIGQALALFFVLAGYFFAAKLQREQAGAATVQRVFLLLKPYVCWAVLYWLYTGMVVHGEVVQEVFGLGKCPQLTPLWFLRDLMCFTVIVFVLFRWRAVLFTAGLICLFLPRWDDSLAWPSTYMFGDFVLGVMLWVCVPHGLQRYGRLPVTVHVAIVLAAVSLITLKCVDCGMRVDDAFCGVVVLALLSLGIVTERFMPVVANRLARLSQGNFFVYCSHIFVLIILLGLEQCLFAPWPAWLWWVLVPVIYVVTRGIYVLLSRFCPKSLVWLAGGK